MESLYSDSIGGVRVGQTGVLADEVFHAEDAAHPSCVVAEEDASEGGEGADDVGAEGDGGFEAGGGCSCREGDCAASSHGGGIDV